MMEGYIALHRKIFDWEWYKDVPTKVLFIHLLLDVNHKGKSVKGITINRGQTITSIRKLSEQTGLSMQQVRTSLKKLESTHEITQQITHQYTLINVENYDIYQRKQDGSNTVTNTVSNTVSTQNNNDNNILIKDDDARTRARDGLNLSQLLSTSDWDKLDARYDNLADLIDFVDDRVVDTNKIRNPYAYICRMADKENWPRKQRSLTGWIKSF